MRPGKADVSVESTCESESVEPPGRTPGLETLSVPVRTNREFPISDQTRNFYLWHFPGTGSQEWNSWQWQVRNSFTSFKQISRILDLSADERALSEKDINLPLRVTPYYASLLDTANASQALRRTVIPVIDELMFSRGEESDPLGEDHTSPVNHIVHRYPDRVLFLVTGFCSTYCRYCTRSHMVAKKDKCHASQSEWDVAIEYIRQHREVRDVLLSGGDPLTLSDSRIEYLLSRLRAIDHVEIIRIGTKVPMVLPQRITTTLVRMLRKYHPLFISVHCTHPDEISLEARTALTRLADAGIPLGSQTVLLKGVNDDPGVFRKLTHELLKARVRPYYLYQCDPIPGSSHFRTPVAKGLEVIRGLRGHTSGYAVPHYVIDAPGGGGKIPLLPEYVAGKVDGNLVLVNYENKTFKYPDYL